MNPLGEFTSVDREQFPSRPHELSCQEETGNHEEERIGDVSQETGENTVEELHRRIRSLGAMDKHDQTGADKAHVGDPTRHLACYPHNHPLSIRVK